jgi:tetratricopeptide (TPR) repeat protein
VERIATALRDRYGLRIFLDKWEIHRGPIHAVVEEGIRKSRALLLACTADALRSEWVAAEEDIARAIDPRGRQIIPLRLDDAALPPRLSGLRWYDFRDPTQEAAALVELAAALGGELAVTAARRAPAAGDDVGAFPPPPRYRFVGRARELHELERAFGRHRAVLLSGMGGMGKTSLAREAAFWWTRTGLFPDGACFLSFERGAGADQAVHTLGTYLLGEDFASLPADRQWAEAARLFREKRVLMVWDNFESVLPQFQGSQTFEVSKDLKGLARLRRLFDAWTGDERGRGRLLITCRPEEAGLPAARRFALGGLARPDSLTLASHVFELHGIPRDDPRLARGELEKLLDLMGDHPLSIELVFPHLTKPLSVADAIARYAELLAAEHGKAAAAAARAGRPVERNESLLASLAFSASRLSPAARDALPWLGWFTAGVFEDNLLDFAGISPEAWAPIRGELEGTALISVDDTWQLSDRPYLRFHPTLPYAAALIPTPLPTLGEGQGVRAKRFVAVYRAVRQAVDAAFFGKNPRGGMEVMAREEGNFRLAVARALALGDAAAAADLGDTMGIYLQLAGRLGERDRWAAWLGEQVAAAGWSAAAAGAEIAAAWALLSQGQPAEAIDRLEALARRLEGTAEFDPAFQLALARQWLGKALDWTGQAERAIPILERAVREWERLGREKGSGERDWGSGIGGNLAACLGDLANALMSAGRLEEALAAAERALEAVKAQGRDRDVASAQLIIAQILAAQGRHAEVDGRYEQALAAARVAGDQELEGITLQHQGILADYRGDLEAAARLYREALKRFEAMHNEGAIMRTCNLLGVVEQRAGRLAAARGWYERARELARGRGDQEMLGAVAQNLGIVAQREGEAARAAGDEAAARGKFAEAVRSVQESLAAWQQAHNRPNEAASYSQLGQLYLLLAAGAAAPAADLARAEEHAHRAREIREELRLPEVYKDYWTLEGIAQARGDVAAAAAWRRKREAVQAELRRRAGGGGVDPRFVKAVEALCLAAGRVALRGEEVSPQVEENVAALEKAPAPWGAVGGFLRAVIGRRRPLPAIPSGLPEEIERMVRIVRQELEG